MTPERLAALKLRAHSPAYAVADRVELLAEVDRLRALPSPAQVLREAAESIWPEDLVPTEKHQPGQALAALFLIRRANELEGDQ